MNEDSVLQSTRMRRACQNSLGQTWGSFDLVHEVKVESCESISCLTRASSSQKLPCWWWWIGNFDVIEIEHVMCTSFDSVELFPFLNRRARVFRSGWPRQCVQSTRRVFGAYLWEQWVKLCVSTGSGWSNVFSCVCQCQSNHEPSCMIRELWWEQSFLGGIKRSWMKRYVWILYERAFPCYLLKCNLSLTAVLFLFRHGAGCVCATPSPCGSSSCKVRVTFLLDCCYIVLFMLKWWLIWLLTLFSFSFFVSSMGGKHCLRRRGKCK